MQRYHLILDLGDTVIRDLVAPDQQEKIEKWFSAVLNAIDMECISGPHFKYGDGIKPGSQMGWTMVSVIDFSSITIHHFQESNQVKVDIFSCKPFNVKLAEDITKQYFGNSVEYKNYIEV